MFKRPLSPHLQVYKLPLAARISISHRVIGAFFFGGIVIVALYSLLILFSINFSCVNCLIFSWFGKLISSLLIAAINFYILTEIRYIIWGFNLGFHSLFVKTSNILIIVLSVIFSLLCWRIIWE
jgi:succinate dehydrogenase / fumarate reductase cytochrome b subunit